MSLLLGSIRSKEEDSEIKKDIVLWSRIDQKSCFKAIHSAGLICVVVPTKIEGDEVITDIDAMEAALEKHGDRVLAVITTASCFAPRVPDAVDKVAKLCKVSNVYHVINNAYGLQCAKTSKLINRACVVGRVDAVVCSTDKNFLVPVGK
jgi:O-phospho-L-seryl-tRNASec:L-selenocysteinyl-tRNA synthase